jgi:sugar (pentulose or hexulose) kinase
MATRKGGAGRGEEAAATAVPVTAATLAVVQIEPLRAEAAEALGRGEKVQVVVGMGDGGDRVETLVFTASGKGSQSSGIYVHRGDWTGGRLVTEKGHLLDADGSCFCRDCETAGGYTVDDDE